MAWIEPLELKTWIVQVFAGSPTIFGTVAIIIICGMAGFFRMNTISLFFMMGLFLIMFSGILTITMLTPFIIIGAFIAGYWISRFFR